MAIRIRTVRTPEEFSGATGGIEHYFGATWTSEESEQLARLVPYGRMHAAFDGAAVVGGAGVYPLELTVPGGPVTCAGVTMIGVLPTHRRRGISLV